METGFLFLVRSDAVKAALLSKLRSPEKVGYESVGVIEKFGTQERERGRERVSFCLGSLLESMNMSAMFT